MMNSVILDNRFTAYCRMPATGPDAITSKQWLTLACAFEQAATNRTGRMLHMMLTRADSCRERMVLSFRNTVNA